MLFASEQRKSASPGTDIGKRQTTHVAMLTKAYPYWLLEYKKTTGTEANAEV